MSGALDHDHAQARAHSLECANFDKLEAVRNALKNTKGSDTFKAQSENHRPVWINRELAEALYEHAKRTASAPVMEVVNAWDRAPADATKAVQHELDCYWLEPPSSVAVLRALGMPGA